MRSQTLGHRRGVLLLGVLFALAAAQAAAAHEGHDEASRAFAAGYKGPKVAVGGGQAFEAVQQIVQLAASVPSVRAEPLLPAGTRIDRVAWNGSVVEIDLTIAAPANWGLGAVDLESIGRALAQPFLHDSNFGGTRTRARRSANQPYGTLETLLRIRPRPPVEGPPPLDTFGPLSPQPITADGSPPANPPGPQALGGPTASGPRQPAGALSGVVVYVSAGHGWTAGTSAWFLQRPVLNRMCEDYGNIDQLNYFVHYAFNAGATVVPFRPVGWQPIEIVLDNDDPGVTFAGSWSDGVSSKYYENGVTNSGVIYRSTSASATETATARYTPNMTTTGFYPVYCFTIASSNRTVQTYRISHSGGVSAIAVDHRLTGNGWVWLGEYYFQSGGANYVEITNQSAVAGAIIADAIRWGGGYGDVSRPGPNSTSGYPRDEEAQRYWAESELGNHAVGFDSTIWDQSGSDDQSDNVGTAARFAREMNQVPAGGVQSERWRRVHLEFHTNAFDTTARGQICLTSDLGETTNQTQLATILSNEIDADMNLLSGEFEHPWVDRSSPTLNGSYGAISTTNNGNEFDATIVELAFHDNASDADLLRDGRIRSAMGRACVQGLTRFLNSLPGSQVPLAFAPDTPRDLVVRHVGNGDVTLSWQPPLSDGARGDPATGYVVYQSSNGYGFGNPTVLGNVLTTPVSGLTPGEIRYFRVAATNAGGESMPTEVLAVRRPATGDLPQTVLVVNGFDRLRRQINPVQTFTQPAAYNGQQIERVKWRESNSYDYVVQYTGALAGSSAGFASCANEAVANNRIALTDFDVVIWILGTESTEDLAFSTTEQTKVTSYLSAGGALFVTGADVAFDLVSAAHGVSFAQDTLKIGYVANSANSFNVTPAAGGIFNGLASFDFNRANGAAYLVDSADVLQVRSGAAACLNYVGGAGGAAGVQFTGSVYNSVSFGFPFEAISFAATRTQVMQRVLNFLITAGPRPFDYDHDGDVDINDIGIFNFCMHGPGVTYASGHVCRQEDGDGDADVDLLDYARMQLYIGP